VLDACRDVSYALCGSRDVGVLGLLPGEGGSDEVVGETVVRSTHH
jgi:hypothetical protein